MDVHDDARKATSGGPGGPTGRDAVEARIRERLEGLVLRLADMAELAEEAKGAASKEFQDRISQLERKVNDTRERLKALRNEYDNSLGMAKLGIENALDDLEAGLRGAWEERPRFRKH